MLNVQEYLRSGKGLEELKAELGIKYKMHPTLPLVILNYDQLNSPKSHPIVMECRGLVLEIDTWSLIAMGFGRFFNYGEVPAVTEKFEWNKPFECVTKEDGSYINFFKYENDWVMSTRGSWGEEECGFSGKTWKELVLAHIPKKLIEDGDDIFNYVFEFTSIHNKIVRMYKEPGLILLAMIGRIPNQYGEHELSSTIVDIYAKHFGFKRPERFMLESPKEIEVFLSKQAEKDPTFEGVVVKDCNGLRLKIKSVSYCCLHHLKGEGDNMFNVKYIVPLVLNGETEELLTYFPEVEDRFLEVRDKMDKAYKELCKVFLDSLGIENQKELAQFIIPRTPFNSLIFKARKGSKSLKEYWAESAQLILKVLFNK